MSSILSEIAVNDILAIEPTVARSETVKAVG